MLAFYGQIGLLADRLWSHRVRWPSGALAGASKLERPGGLIWCRGVSRYPVGRGISLGIQGKR